MKSILLAAVIAAEVAGVVTGGAAATAAAQKVAVTAAEQVGFTQWRDGFRARALAQGVPGELFDRAFAGVGVNAKVLEHDRRQPEFTRPIWEYLDSAVSDNRIATGREKRVQYASALAQIETRYGVSSDIVLAVWGLESAYGYNYGDFSIVEALATLAYEGRRRAFGEKQLLSALRILRAGDIAPERMKGSWAGAMGHTQFIPTSFEAYAVDFDGDGRRDIWSENPVDALASAANYLARAGWRRGEPWGVEVRLPVGINYDLLDDAVSRPSAFWRELGVTTIAGAAPPDFGEASVIIPGGARGPAFMVFHNFRVIKRYNNATSYALAVGYLGDRLGGGPALAGSWPRGDRPLSRNENVEMQRRLTGLGYDTRGLDGIIGPNTRTALRAFQRHVGLPPDGYPSAVVLKRLRAARNGG